MKEYDKAIKDCDEAIRLDPTLAEGFCARGRAWTAKQQYDKAVRDYDEAIRLDPNNPFARFWRALAHMMLRRPESTREFQEVLDLEGWKGDLAPKAVVFGHLAARQAKDAPTAKRFLRSADKLDESWPYPAVRFLRGEIDEAALLALASDEEQRTQVHCYLGLDHALKGNKEKALAHFRWVKEHGDPRLDEYGIALGELSRLESPEESDQ